MDKKTQLSVVIVLAVVIIIVGGLVIVALSSPRRQNGTLIMNITEVGLLDRPAGLLLQLNIDVGNGYRSSGYPWNNDTGFVFMAFENVKSHFPVVLTVRDRQTHKLECVFAFTPQELAERGFMAITKRYNISSKCTIVLNVDFSQLDVMSIMSNS